VIPRGEDGYYHPSNEAEICELVKHAAANGLRVRVRGSSHSVPPAIYTSPPVVDPHSYHTWPPDDEHINIYLDRMMAVEFDHDTMQVTVEAGCHLG
jgi:FAD/FMN-containing dehydrogenase